MNGVDSLDAAWAEAEAALPGRVMMCPECGRITSVAPYAKSVVCVHAWASKIPEVWDWSDTSLAHSVNPAWREPGPDTWTRMVPLTALALRALAAKLRVAG